MEQRTCPVCRRRFTPTVPNQRFCPPTAEGRARIKPGNPAVSYCGKAYQNAKARGTLDTLLADARLPPEPFDCARCGRRCVLGENVAAHASRFCGYDCKAAWHGEHVQQHNVVADRLLSIATGKPTGIDTANYRRALRRDPCAYCGAPAEASDHIVPKSHGSSDDWTNRTAACHTCNGSKMQTPLLIFLAWKRARDAFEPWRQIVAEIHTRAA